jgi:hypothetical protein
VVRTQLRVQVVQGAEGLHPHKAKLQRLILDRVAVAVALVVVRNPMVVLAVLALLFFRTPGHKFFMAVQSLRLVETLFTPLILLGCFLQRQCIQQII